MIESASDERLRIILLNIAHVGPDALASERHGSKAEFGDEQTGVA